MDLGAAGLNEQPFRTHGRPLSTVSYASYKEALEVLENTFATANGLSLLQGPTLSGKSTLIRNFVDSVSRQYRAIEILFAETGIIQFFGSYWHGDFR